MISDLLCLCVRMISGLTVLNRSVIQEPRQRIFFCNHTSHLDFLALWSSFPRPLRAVIRPVAARDYWEQGAVRAYIAHNVINAVCIQRGGISVHQGAPNPLQQMLDALDQGYSLIVFPEGTRSAGADIQPFKSGLYRLALKRPEIECVPVFLNNLNRILPKGEILAIPLIGTVVFGPPITIGHQETKEGFLNRAKGSLERIRDEYFQ